VGTSIAVGDAGDLHIGFTDEDSQDLYYATNEGGTWKIELIDSELDYRGGSLALDPAGNVHMCYAASTERELRYATNIGGDWSVHTIDGEGDMMGGDIAVGSDGVVHISYQNTIMRDLMYTSFLPHVPAAPQPPTDLKAMAGNGEVLLSWKAPSDDGGAPVTSYVVYWSNGSAYTAVPVEGTSYLHQDLENGARYEYKVAAVNTMGTDRPRSPCPRSPFRTSPSPRHLPLSLST
jgi:hypothetical protein